MSKDKELTKEDYIRILKSRISKVDNSGFGDNPESLKAIALAVQTLIKLGDLND